MKNCKIGIIGGRGAMGSFFHNFFKVKGFDVLISDIDTKLSNKDIAQKCDMIFLSTPINVTIDIIKEIAPFLNERQLLSDFSSLKENIINAMLKYSKSSVIGMHPMFGPFTNKIAGQNLILSVARDNNSWEKKLKAIFDGSSLNIEKMDAKAHDKHMAFVQGLTHIIAIAMGRTMQKKNIHPAKISSFSTPVFRLNSDIVGRLFNQDPSLYLSIISDNKYTKENVDIFLESLQESKKKILENNNNKSILFLKSIKTFLNGFCHSAFKRTSKALDVFFS